LFLGLGHSPVVQYTNSWSTASFVAFVVSALDFFTLGCHRGEGVGTDHSWEEALGRAAKRWGGGQLLEKMYRLMAVLPEQ